MRPIAALLLVALCVLARAQDASTLALNRIASTKVFAFGGIGYAGVTSPGEKDFRMLMAQPKPLALQSFEKLYATGNGQARAYALAGIRELNPAEFNQLMRSMRSSGEKISTMEGCILEQQAFIDVAARLEAGRYDYWIHRSLPATSTSQKPLGGWIEHR